MIKDAYQSVPRAALGHRDWNIIYQILWEHVHSYKDLFNLQQRQTMVHCKTQTAPSGQRTVPILDTWGPYAELQIL